MLQLLAMLTIAAGLPTATPDSTGLRGEALMTALQQGGYTVVMRHARTDRSFQEDVATIPVSRTQQRNLNDDGVRDARLMGVVFKKYHIPFSEVIASPMFRTMETAEYAVGPATPTMVLRTFPVIPEQLQLLAAAPAPGTNRLIVTHHFVIEAHVPGIKPGDISESEAAVVRPIGDGKIELVGTIHLSDWQALAGTSGQVSSATPAGHNTAANGGYGTSNGIAAVPSTPVTIPDTPIGRIAGNYLHAFNSGSAAQMRAFIDESLATDPNRSTDVRANAMTERFAQIGPLTVTGIESATNAEIVLNANGKVGNVRVTVRFVPEQPGRAAVTSQFSGGHS